MGEHKKADRKKKTKTPKTKRPIKSKYKKTYDTLRSTTGGIAIVSGASKFINLSYISTIFGALYNTPWILYVLGIIEIIAGIGLLTNKKTNWFLAVIGLSMFGSATYQTINFISSTRIIFYIAVLIIVILTAYFENKCSDR